MQLRGRVRALSTQGPVLDPALQSQKGKDKEVGCWFVEHRTPQYSTNPWRYSSADPSMAMRLCSLQEGTREHTPDLITAHGGLRIRAEE